MNSFFRRLTILCLGGLVTLVHAAPITLCYEDEDVYPWILKDSEKKGLNVILLERVAAKSGLKIKFDSMPWKRCLNEIEAGRINGGFAASYKEDRAQYAVYPTANGKPDAARRIRSDTYSLYRPKGSKVNWDGKKFSNLTGLIGVQSGYSIGADLQKMGVEIDEGGKSSEANMRKLLANRTQAVAALTLEADQLLKSRKDLASRIEKLKTPLVEKPYFVIFGKGYYAANTKLVESFWARIESVRNSKEYQTLQADWLKRNQFPEP